MSAIFSNSLSRTTASGSLAKRQAGLGGSVFRECGTASSRSAVASTSAICPAGSASMRACACHPKLRKVSFFLGLDKLVAHGIADEVRRRPQLELAHCACPMCLDCLDADA